MEISVIITTHQRRDGVLECLRAVLEDPGAGEVVLVIDGSTDGTEEAVRERYGRDERLRVVARGNRGQMAAQRTGAATARGDVLLFLDDDVHLAPGVVSGHLRRHREGTVDVVVGHMPCALDGLGPEEWPVHLYQAQYERKVALWSADPQRVLDHLWGGNVSIRRSIWETLPPFPGRRPLGYHMDWELGLRCRWAGATASFDRALAAVHHRRRDLEGFLRDRRRSADDRIRVHELHRSRLGPLPLAHFTQDCSRLTSWAVRRRSVVLAETLRRVFVLFLRIGAVLGLHPAQRRSALDATSLEGAVALWRRERRPDADPRD